MSQVITPTFYSGGLPPRDDDPFRYGWRYVKRVRPDGKEEYDIVPLTYEDLLYPEEEDFVVQKPPHKRDADYLHHAAETYYRDDPAKVVLGDCRVDWGPGPDVRPLGPDVIIIDDVIQWLQQGTFRLAEEGGRPIAVFEVASPNTRDHDLERKPDLYYRVGLLKYVIIDRGPNGERPAKLIGHERGPKNWVVMAFNSRGRIDLAPLTLEIGLEDDRPWLYCTRTGERLPDLTEAVLARDEARAAAEAEKAAREAAQAEAERQAQARAEAETRAREEAEARSRAEAKVREVKAKAHAEEESRSRADAQARREAEALVQAAEAHAEVAEAYAQAAEARAEAAGAHAKAAEARAEAAEAREGQRREELSALEQRLRQLEELVRRQRGQP